MDTVTLGAALALSNKKLAAAMQAIPPAYTYKGSVATVGDLPESADLGDLYTVGGHAVCLGRDGMGHRH